MKREDLIYKKLKELCKGCCSDTDRIKGFTASDIAAKLNMDRGNVSKQLNNLVRKGLVMKTNSRPVKFFDYRTFLNVYHKNQETVDLLADQDDSVFDYMIGGGESLKIQIKQAKAAILYPPNGLHMLLTGPTGSGKTTFAQMIYDYAISMSAIKKDAKFVVFNCAEYADNPQLILSLLFGYRKGAFTGAVTNKGGLVEEADGGILFLDEIHRLPPEGQEMLFTLMDYGRYRRLGDVDNEKTANVIIIGATTENKDAALLKTFLRRIQVLIELPALKDRPMLDRLQFIELFIANEQKNISAAIRVSKEVILSLLLYECPGNVGQLKSDIQLICARSFLDYKIRKESMVLIDKKSLPVYVEQGLYKNDNGKNMLIQYIKKGDEDYVFTYDKKEAENSKITGNKKGRYYNVISQKYHLFIQGSLDGDAKIWHQSLDEYINSLNMDRENYSRNRLLKIVSLKVYNAAEEAIHFAEMRLGKIFSERVKVGFILHVNMLSQNTNRNVDMSDTVIREMIQQHQKEYKVAVIIAKMLEDDLGLHLRETEDHFILMFLCADETIETFKKIGVIIATHGGGTASGIAETVNQILKVDHCKSINMNLDEKVEGAYQRTLHLVREADEGKGVLLLVDMGSLNMFAGRIQEETGIHVVSIGMVSTIMAIEAVRKATMLESDINEVANYLKNMVAHYFDKELYERIESLNKYQIVVTCMSGEGAALRIAEIVEQILDGKGSDRIEIVNRGVLAKGLDAEKVLAVIGTVDLKLKNVPFISVDELIVGEGIQKIEKLLVNSGFKLEAQEQKKETEETEMDPNSAMVNIIVKKLLDFLDSEKIVPFILKSLNQCASDLHLVHIKEYYIRYIIHAACMLERLLKGEILPYHNIDILKKQNEKAFSVIKASFFEIEKMLSLDVPDTEIIYLLQIIKAYERV